MSESTVETTQPSTPLSTLAPLINVFPPSLPQSPYDMSVLIANIVSGISNTKITPSNVPLLIPIIMSKVVLIKQLNVKFPNPNNSWSVDVPGLEFDKLTYVFNIFIKVLGVEGD